MFIYLQSKEDRPIIGTMANVLDAIREKVEL